MSTTKKLIKSAQRLLRNVLQLGNNLTKQVMNWLLRNLFVLRRHPNSSQAGFVLPTVIMVMLVVTLLTAAILFRSFDRAKNASNVRINQATLSAATPALDRARAKVDKLFSDPLLPRGTPSDTAIASVIEPSNSSNPDYEFDDEIPLEITDGAGTAHTAWRFPVDTDNNGKYDSFTIYSILYKTPTDPDAQRNPLQARTGPMTTGSTNPACAAATGTTASLVGSGGWVLVDGILKKSIFVYVATVPITDSTVPGYNTDYELYQKGNKGFSAIELQADIPRVPLSNNAVVYEDDMEVFAGSDFSLNGRVMTNSNLFLYQNADLKLRLVSSPDSCFYAEENSKIVVGGNVAYGYIANADTSGDVKIDLFQGRNTPPTEDQPFSTTNQSVTGTPATIGYNTLAYEKRIAKFVENATVTTPLPAEVEEDMDKKGLSEEEALDRYFRKRVRRVPYAEVGYGATDNKINLTTVTGTGDELRPSNDRLVYPFQNDGLNSIATGNAFLALKENGDLLYPGATEFEEQEQLGKENELGDRVLVGNNLPELRYEGNEWVGKETPQDIKKNASTPYKWNAPAGETSPRQRKTRVETLADAGDVSRDGFWERASLDPEVFTGEPKDELDPTGGLRVVTGAGIYLPEDNATDQSNVVWPDSMPAIGPWATGSTPWGSAFPTDTAGEERPYLKMRATAVYHYRHEQGQEPIACVATYYDPTNRLTANNSNPFIASLAQPGTNVSGEMITDYDPDGPGSETPRRPNQADGARSVNGITYGPPDTTDLSSYLTYLSNQVYPNGRPVNPILKEALSLAVADRDIHHQAAIDAARCGLNIYGAISGQTDTFGQPAGINNNYPLPHGTIKETAFLDARQIKAIDGTYNPGTQTTSYTLDGNYTLPIAQRYPLEIRATVIDLDQLRRQTADGTTSPQEYMLPNSGIIYATRNDALPDDSDRTTINDINPDRVSSTDFLLDPTRSPNGIMLVNGAKLFRDRNNYREVEKGLIVASNLPVYIKAQPSSFSTLEGFNPHQDQNANSQEEFTTPVTDANFYTRTTLNTNFACRIGDPRLPSTSCTVTGADEWRPAAVISDAVTLLSSSFREGFRNEGDYDLRNNQIDNVNDGSLPVDPATGTGSIEQKRLQNGFWNNNFVTNGLSSNLDGIANVAAFGPAKTDQDYSTPGGVPRNSSYFNNMVTPVQRRVRFSEYVMEICRKLPVSDCQPSDWVVNVEEQGNVQVWNVPLETPVADINTGTTDKAPESPQDQRYPRRVAFLRNPSNGHLITTGTAPNLQPIPLGISTDGKVNYYPHAATTLKITDNKFDPSGGTATSFPAFDEGIPSGRPRLSNNALWYGTKEGTATRPGRRDRPLSYQNQITGNMPNEHPLLRPALQLQNTTNVENGGAINNAGTVHWLPRATVSTSPPNTTIYNLVMATKDSPSRPKVGTHEGDIGGALSVLPRFLENWTTEGQTIQISGSFIQTKRSAYATAPFYQLPNTTSTAGLFSDIQAYKTGNAGKASYYEASSREWGFDVGLLSQIPDLFAQKFAVSPDEQPNLFYREVSRNDPWLEPLLCAKTLDQNGDPDDFALPETERPNSCS